MAITTLMPRNDFATNRQRAGLRELPSELVPFIRSQELLLVAWPFLPVHLFATEIDGIYEDYCEVTGLNTGGLYRASYNEARFYVKASLYDTLLERSARYELAMAEARGFND